MRSLPLTAVVTPVSVCASLLCIACTGGGEDEPAEISVESMCRAWCEQLQECQPQVFEQNHGSLDACRESCEQDAGDFYDGYPTPECVDEALTKDICVAGLSCEQLEAMDYASCQDEFDALQECLGHTDGGI